MKFRCRFPPTALACLVAACATGSASRCTTKVYAASDLRQTLLRRVAFVPFEDEAEAGPAVREIQRALAQEFEKATAAEVVQIDPLSHIEVAKQAPPRRTGEYQLEAIAQLGARHGVDAVLFGAVTAWRPYVPQHLGVRLDLVSTQTGHLLWSAFADFDLADADASGALEAAYRRYAKSAALSLSWRQAQSSPARVTALVAAEAVASLKMRR